MLRESAAESRFEALHGPELTPLVGRDEELALLQRRWQQAKAGEGCVVLLSGEPGIGKSRLAQTLLERLSGRAAHPPALLLLAAPPGQRALSRRSPSSNGRPGFRREDTAEAAARQAGGGARPGDRRSRRGRSAARGVAVDPDRRPLPAARPHPAEAKGEDASGAGGAGAKGWRRGSRC